MRLKSVPVVLLLMLLCVSGLPGSVSMAQTTDNITTITYQGYITNSGGAVSGLCNFEFKLFDALTAGSQIGSTITLSGITVTEGNFAVELNFGSGAFNGQDRFLEIGVQCGTDTAITLLSPRQDVTPSAYSIYALGVDWTNIANIPADFADGVDNANDPSWELTGNAGLTPGTNFIGTTDAVVLDFYTNNVRALRLEPAVPAANFIGGGASNAVNDGAAGAVISGGGPVDEGSADTTSNRIFDNYGVIGGGANNVAGSSDGTPSNAVYATIGGGLNNQALALISTVGGGQNNTATGAGGVIAGGDGNTASGVYAYIGGGNLNVSSSLGTTVTGGVNNTASASYAVVGGGSLNIARGQFSTVSGGGPSDGTASTRNRATDDFTVVAGGANNQAGTDDVTTTNAIYATVSGGFTNQATGAGSNIGGGQRNVASGANSHVLGGTDNVASGSQSTVGGGYQNVSSGLSSVVSGGFGNVASGLDATVPGGQRSEAIGDYTFAFGRRAIADDIGAMLFADGSTSTAFNSITPNEFAVRATGGVRFITNAGGSGARLASGGSSWIALSDASAKENFEAVDTQAVLDAIRDMPIMTWNYISQDERIRHMGPVAQDFSAAFGLGEDPLGINTIDADGVALAAIQGLAEELEERDAEIASLEARLAALESGTGVANGGVNWMNWLPLGLMILVGLVITTRRRGIPS